MGAWKNEWKECDGWYDCAFEIFTALKPSRTGSDMKKTIALISGCSAILFLLSMKAVGVYSQAYYPGGKTAMEAYFKDSLRYPESEKKAGKEEIIRVTFEVSAEGVAQNPQMTSLFGGSIGFDEEVKRLISDMPKWEPDVDGKGKPIASMEYTIVSFRLPDSLVKVPGGNDSVVYSFAEEMPHMQGGESSFQTYLQWMIHYPQMELEQGKDGTVYIYFEVTD